MTETNQERSSRILGELKNKYPDVNVIDLDGNGTHFVAEVEPATDHSEYDRAIEVIIKSAPHKHLQMTQQYKILSGTLSLHVDNETVHLGAEDTYTVKPGQVHWAESDDECWLEIYSEPGWTAGDHIPVQL